MIKHSDEVSWAALQGRVDGSDFGEEGAMRLWERKSLGRVGAAVWGWFGAP